MSLLTQFYNCDSGAGGGKYITLGGFKVYVPDRPCVIFTDAQSGTSTSANWISPVSSDNHVYPATYLFPVGAASTTGSLTTKFADAYLVKGVTITTFFRPSGSTLVLEDAILGRFQGSFTSTIEGTGVLCLLDSTFCNGLTSISTGIGFNLSNRGTVSEQTHVLTNTSLDAASVNHILESMFNSGCASLANVPSLDLSGGTAAGTSALTAAGTAALTALTGAGWTITLNP